MARGALKKIDPIIPDKAEAIPAGAKEWGRHPDTGQIIYELTRKRSRSEPDLDENGKQRMQRNLQGEPLYPLRRPVLYDEHLLFTIEFQGSGNMGMQPYFPPTEEELAEKAKKERAAAIRERLFEVLAESGKTPEELVEALLAGGAPVEMVPASEPSSQTVTTDGGSVPDAETLPEEPFPRRIGESHWYLLSNGDKVQGKDAADTAQGQIDALVDEQQERARKAAEATPEV